MNQINEKIEKISKSFSDLYKILDEFGTEEDKDAFLEIVKLAIIGIVASEKKEDIALRPGANSESWSTGFKSSPVSI